MCRWLLGTPTSLFGPALPLAYQVTSAGELRAAHQGEGAGRKAPAYRRLGTFVGFWHGAHRWLWGL